MPDYTASLDQEIAGLRIGVPDGPPFTPVQSDVGVAFAGACDELAALGVELVPVVIPELAHTSPQC